MGNLSSLFLTMRKTVAGTPNPRDLLALTLLF
jgi:hypothetical protein